MNHGLRAAFSTIDITPVNQCRVGRLGINILMPTGIHSRLSARLALFEADGVRVAICAADLNVMLDPCATELRTAISRGAGLPSSHVVFCWTHTHNAPATWPWLITDEGFDYLDSLGEKVYVAASEAAQSLQPCRLQAGTTEAPDLAFNRRPLYRQPDGRLQAGTHGPRRAPDFTRMEGPDESRLHVVRAVDMNGAAIGGIVNFAIHPTCTYGVPLFSADYPGALRVSMEQRHGGTWLYLNGAAGNLAPPHAIPGRTDASATDLAEYVGFRLADHASRALNGVMEVDTGEIRVASEILRIPQRDLPSTMVQTARNYLDTTAAKQPWTGRLCEQLYGYAYHFYHLSPPVDDWLARDIIGMWEWRRRVGSRRLIEEVEIQTMRIGDIGLAAFPCELFSEFSSSLRAASPFNCTLIAQMANGWHGYIPPAAAFANGGYECCFALQSRLAPDAGERMAAAAGHLLNRLAI